MQGMNQSDLNYEAYVYAFIAKHHLTPAQMKALPPSLGVIVFETGTQTFHFISPNQKKTLQQGIDWLIPAVQHLMQANANPPCDEAEASRYAQRKTYFNSIMQSVVQGPGQNKLHEFISLTNQCWWYVSDAHYQFLQLKNSYKVADEAMQAAILENGKLSVPKLLEKLVGPHAFHYRAKVEGAMTPLANALGVPSENIHKLFFSNPQDKYMQYTANADAQLMRYTAGMGAKGSFDPKDGRFSFSAKGQTKLTLASASIHVECFMPSEVGYHAAFMLSVPPNVHEPVDLGYFRVMLKLSAAGFVGASLEGSVSMKCSMDPNTGKLQVKGANVPSQPHKSNAPNFGVKAGVDAFAGAKAGGEVAAACQWQNPEKAKGDITKPEFKAASWDAFAKIDAKGDVAAGVGIDGNFAIHYDQRSEKFLVHIEAGLVCGVGASGSLTVVVYEQHIHSFIQFVYHKIMNAVYSYIGILEDLAFKMLVDIFTKFIFYAESNLVTIFETELATLDTWWNNLLADMEGDVNINQIYAITNNINNDPGRLTFTPPEVKGRLLYILTDQRLPAAIASDAQETVAMMSSGPVAYMNPNAMQQALSLYQSTMQSIESAILTILSYIQCYDDYKNVVTHMGLNPLAKNGLTEGEHWLYENLVTEHADLSRLRQFRLDLNDNHQAKQFKSDRDGLLIFAGRPNYNQPVKQNKTVLNIRGPVTFIQGRS